MIEGVSALGATKSAASSLGSAGVAGIGGVSDPGGDFGQVMSQVVSDAVGTLHAGEAAAIEGLKGSMPAYQVVEKVMAAQRTLQSALAIRDKAVSAYQDIARMSI